MSIARLPVKAVVDTSVYIPFINNGFSHPVIDGIYGQPVLYMSSVVIEELYAGAFDAISIKLIDRLYETFERLNRLIVPNASDWQKAGKVVAKLGRKYGFESLYLARIQNDVLIALSARQIGAYVITGNMKDYERIREFLDFKLYPPKDR
jgi:predicted nucleic acid-binding protein